MSEKIGDDACRREETNERQPTKVQPTVWTVQSHSGNGNFLSSNYLLTLGHHSGESNETDACMNLAREGLGEGGREGVVPK